MLKTNSKQAKSNIRAYIIENYTPYDYDLEETNDYKEIAHNIINEFRQEKSGDWYVRNMTEQERFVDWCQGLPSIIDTCYFYNRSAVDDLGDILEETEEERNKYTEEQAEMMLSRLIYRELINA